MKGSDGGQHSAASIVSMHFKSRYGCLVTIFWPLILGTTESSFLIYMADACLELSMIPSISSCYTWLHFALDDQFPSVRCRIVADGSDSDHERYVTLSRTG
jgi:hypothetical protein